MSRKKSSTSQKANIPANTDNTVQMLLKQQAQSVAAQQSIQNQMLGNPHRSRNKIYR